MREKKESVREGERSCQKESVRCARKSMKKKSQSFNNVKKRSGGLPTDVIHVIYLRLYSKNQAEGRIFSRYCFHFDE